MKKNFPAWILLLVLFGCNNQNCQPQPSNCPDVAENAPAHLIAPDTVQQDKTGVEVVEEYEKNIILRLDSNKENDLPKRFRTSYSEFSPIKDEFGIDTSYVPTRKGLEDLKISGSGQFSESEFKVMMSKIREKFKGTVYIVDLRQESHGFINGIAVSWYKTHNWANMDLTEERIEKDEDGRMKNITGKPVSIYAIKSKNSADNLHVVAEEVITEKAMAARNGASYVRFPCVDHTWPAADMIDAFIAFYKTLPDDVWLHFHCSGGVGRTAAFMALVDMMRNPDLSLKDIAYRQASLKGNYLLYVPEEYSWKKEGYQIKSIMFRHLYQYVQQNHANGFQTTWTEYLRQY